MQKVCSIDYIQCPEFGLSQSKNNFKIHIECSLGKSKMLNSSHLCMDYLKNYPSCTSVTCFMLYSWWAVYEIMLTIQSSVIIGVNY